MINEGVRHYAYGRRNSNTGGGGGAQTHTLSDLCVSPPQTMTPRCVHAQVRSVRVGCEGACKGGRRREEENVVFQQPLRRDSSTSFSNGTPH